MHYEYINPLKLELAKEEVRVAQKKDEDYEGTVHEAYVRRGGKFVEHEDAPVVEEGASKPKNKKK